MPALFVWREQAVLFLVACVDWCYGTTLSVFASATADLYGTRNLGLNYGVLFTAWGAAGIFGPMIGGRVFGACGDYRSAFSWGPLLDAENRCTGFPRMELYLRPDVVPAFRRRGGLGGPPVALAKAGQARQTRRARARSTAGFEEAVA